MPNYYAYLRVSRDVQDVKNQLHGIHEYANDRRMTPLIQIRETASRSKTWQEREIGTLLTETAQKGDVILTSEITRIAGSPMQVFSMLEVAAKRGINIIVTKMDMPLNSGLNGQIQAAVYAIASMIEVEFVRARTREGLARARLEGRVGGRKLGSTGSLKLDPKLEKVGELYRLGLSIPRLANHFDVTEKTMRKFVRRNFAESYGPPKPKRPRKPAQES